MSAAATTAPAVTEKTFSTYSQEQSAHYQQVRRDYHPSLYQAVLDRHISTGGQLETLLDVGCGPGLALRNLAAHFKHATGLDPGASMIATARSKPASTSTSEPVRFEISSAETLGQDLSPPLPDASVDLITAANAAHWFDMAGFWRAAARVLNPGGSVALWCSGEVCVHPDTPNAAIIQAGMDQIMDEHLKPYYVRGNLLTRNAYRELPLPWTLEQPVAALDEASFYRKDWTLGEPFFLGDATADLDMFEKMMATSSPVTRWREAHAEDVGTERDVVRMMRRAIEKPLHEAGVEKGKEIVRGYSKGALLVVKKKQL